MGSLLEKAVAKIMSDDYEQTGKLARGLLDNAVHASFAGFPTLTYDIDVTDSTSIMISFDDDAQAMLFKLTYGVVN